MTPEQIERDFHESISAVFQRGRRQGFADGIQNARSLRKSEPAMLVVIALVSGATFGAFVYAIAARYGLLDVIGSCP